MGTFLVCILFIFVYFIPTVVASTRKHHNYNAIFLVNLFFGWSVIGWFGALIWASTNPPPARG